jgi:surface antigen
LLPWPAAKTRPQGQDKNGKMIAGMTTKRGLGFAAILLMVSTLASCTTSGSTRLDETGERLAETEPSETPEAATFYIQALRGGLIARLPDVRFSKGNRVRALEAEYNVLETAPAGQKIVWEGEGGMRGEVVAAVPFQVGSQNCRQYTHEITLKSTQKTARGAACRNANGSWTPLT